MAGKSRAECKIVSEAVWARAKADYLSGMTAGAVAERHGMGVGGLRGRIQRERWSKAAHAAANAPPLPPAADPSQAPLDPEDIQRGALARASAALLAGRPAEATAIVEALDAVLDLASQIPITLEEAVERNVQVFRTLKETVRELAEHLLGDGEVFERAAWARKRPRATGPTRSAWAGRPGCTTRRGA